jgi:hypothetical protein
MEASHCYQLAVPTATAQPSSARLRNMRTAAATAPSRAATCIAVAGFLLVRRLRCADYCSGRIWALRHDGGR